MSYSINNLVNLFQGVSEKKIKNIAQGDGHSKHRVDSNKEIKQLISILTPENIERFHKYIDLKGQIARNGLRIEPSIQIVLARFNATWTNDGMSISAKAAQTFINKYGENSLRRIINFLADKKPAAVDPSPSFRFGGEQEGFLKVICGFLGDELPETKDPILASAFEKKLPKLKIEIDKPMPIKLSAEGALLAALIERNMVRFQVQLKNKAGKIFKKNITQWKSRNDKRSAAVLVVLQNRDNLKNIWKKIFEIGKYEGSNPPIPQPEQRTINSFPWPKGLTPIIFSINNEKGEWGKNNRTASTDARGKGLVYITSNTGMEDAEHFILSLQNKFKNFTGQVAVYIDPGHSKFTEEDGIAMFTLGVNGHNNIILPVNEGATYNKSSGYIKLPQGKKSGKYKTQLLVFNVNNAKTLNIKGGKGLHKDIKILFFLLPPKIKNASALKAIKKVLDKRMTKYRP